MTLTAVRILDNTPICSSRPDRSDLYVMYICKKLVLFLQAGDEQLPVPWVFPTFFSLKVSFSSIILHSTLT